MNKQNRIPCLLSIRLTAQINTTIVIATIVYLEI